MPSSSSLSNDSVIQFNKDHSNDRFQRRPQTFDGPSSGTPQYQSSYKDGPVNYQDSSRRSRGENNFNHRGQPQQQQQNVPPRFAKLGRGDGQRTGGSGRSDGGGGSGGYRGGEERYGGSREGGNESRLDSYSNHSPAPLKESNQNYGQRSPQNFSGPNREAKFQSSKMSEPQNEKRHYQNDQIDSDSKRQPVSQTGSDSRGAYRNNYGDQNVRQDSGSYRQQNYGNSQNRTSSRSDNRYGPSELPRGQTNNRSYNQQPPLMPTPYSHQPPQDTQYAPVSSKQGYDDRQVGNLFILLWSAFMWQKVGFVACNY